MKFLTLLLLAAAAPNVDVATLDGTAQSGTLGTLSADSLTLQSDGEAVEIATSELLQLRMPPAAQAPELPEGVVTARLNDGSLLHCSDLSVAGADTRLKSPSLGEFSVPRTAIASLRFAAPDTIVDQAWSELVQRDLKQDLLVVRRGDVLDHLDGIIGDIGGGIVKFVHQQEEIPVKREKIFGVIYARGQYDGPQPKCEVSLARGDMLRATQVSADGETFQVSLLGSATIAIPAADVQSLDFSLGKIRYLSQLEPREVKYTPYFDYTWEYERDRNKEGGPLQLRSRTFARGLWIHSKTFLRYRIGGEYRHFQAVMGIDELVASQGLGDVHVVISGDGKILLEGSVRGTDEPRPIKLDVTGVRDLEILVDFGGHFDISDHLVLGDAKVVK